MIRCFAALTLPDSLHDTLEAAQAGLAVGRLVEPENLHLTLAFFGELREPVAEDLHLALDEIVAPPVSVSVSGMGLFGGERPRALYAAVRKEPALTHLRRKVVSAARQVGLELRGGRFVPHVTLARLEPDLSVEDRRALEAQVGRGMSLATDPVTVTEFVLMRSTLHRQGPIHDVLAEYPLRGQAPPQT